MTIDQTAHHVQVAFPQVYLACHTRHQRKRSTPHRLSPRDSAILAHLDPVVPMSHASLATHLGVAKSTLSAALKHLTALGYARPASHRKSGGILLTPQGVQAIRDTSVLESARLRRVLAVLGPRERARVAHGLNTLARACRRAGALGRTEA
jgi:DNA-binding MarR family transcriptional regulator